MRKIYTIMIALLMVFMGFMIVTPPAAAHTEDDPFETNIIADGGSEDTAFDVGDITIWNDGDNLHVIYEIDVEGWYLTETHLEIKESLGDIAHTKKGNPIPGQFTFTSTHAFEDHVVVKEYVFDLDYYGFDVDDILYIAAHAVVAQSHSSVIDFEQYTEKDFISSVTTDCGNVGFYMTSSNPLVGLSLGNTASLTPSGTYPQVAAPDTSLPYENIVAFTVGSSLRDDYVLDDGGTGAGGNTLTDPQDTTQTPLLWHAYSNYEAIVIDVSAIERFQGISLAGIDLDHNEVWYFQYFDEDGVLIHQDTVGPGVTSSGDGVAFPVSHTDPDISKIAIWGAMNLNERERIGYAIDNIAINCYETETGWGEGPEFGGKNWAMYITYTVQAPPVIITFPENGNAYIGYEDRPTGGDFDYNDFGMDMSIQEIYVDNYLSEISMVFTSLVRLAGDRHDIHIARTLASGTLYKYTIERTTAAYGTETPECFEETGSGSFDFILFDTNGFLAGDVVLISIEVTTSADTYDPTPTAPRWDLDPLFAYYNPYMYDKSVPNTWNIDSWQQAASPLPSTGYYVPQIIVVPETDWLAPIEGVTITTPYPDFDDYYSTQSSTFEDWYLP